TYFVQSITNYKVDPSVRSRAFDSTANDVENYINWGEMAGDLTPAAPYTEAIAEGAKIALEFAKGINDFLDPPDQPEVDCSGLLASEFISVNVGDKHAAKRADEPNGDTPCEEGIISRDTGGLLSPWLLKRGARDVHNPTAARVYSRRSTERLEGEPGHETAT